LSNSIDLGLRVVDRQLLDSEERRCGKVDDLALEGGPGEALEVIAILSGPDVWRARAGLVGRLAAWVGRGGRIRIPWKDVAEIDVNVRLSKRAQDLGLGHGDDRLRPFIAKIPDADR